MTARGRIPHLGYVVHGGPGGHPGSAEVRVVRRIDHGTRLGFFTANQVSPAEFVARRDRVRYDTILVQRDALDLQLVDGFLWEARSRRVRVVFEVDDDFVSESAQARLLSQEYDVRRLESIRRLSEQADAVIVSTPTLTARFAELSSRVIEIANELDPSVWHSLTGDERDALAGDVRVLYVGSATHGADLALLEPVFNGLVDSAGNPVMLEVVGVTPEDGDWFRRLPIPPGSLSYPVFARWLQQHRQRWAFAVAPLVDDYFNASKSDLKFLENTMLGLATIASDVTAYSGHEGNGAALVANSTGAWRDAVLHFANDSGVAEDAARRAADYVSTQRTMSDLSDWLHVLFDREGESFPRRRRGGLAGLLSRGTAGTR